LSAAPKMQTSVPVVCLEAQADIWALAQASLHDDGAFLLLRCPGALDELLSLAEKIGPAILLASSEFLERSTRPKIRNPWAFDSVRVIVITGSKPDEKTMEHYIREGCSGILNLKDDPEVWRQAIRSVSAGELWAPRKTCGCVLRELLLTEQRTQARKLTQREEEILKLIGSGQSNRDIANRLFITKETVRWHVRALYSKLGVTDRSSAIQLFRSAARSSASDRPEEKDSHSTD
jgi:DNA-binding NarL/FixJ family response regulator